MAVTKKKKTTSKKTHKIPNTAGRGNKAGRKPKLNMDQLLARIVSLMARHHPKDMSFSMVARLCDVPRSTLYYYFGSDRQNMLREAAQFSMKTFVQLYSLEADAKSPSWEEFQGKRFANAMGIVKKYPWAPAVYFRYRNDLGEMGQIVREIEETYLKKYAAAWKRYKGEAPDPRSVRFVAYLKIGLLYGFSQELEIWLGKDGNESQALEQMLDQFSNIINESMEMKFGPQ